MIRFEYEAQSIDGAVSSGAVDALDLDEAAERLRQMGLRITAIRPAMRAGGSLDGRHLGTFNAQLAQATAAGMPMEQAVRLIAEEMPVGRARRTLSTLADELERGADLPAAIRRLGRRFPMAYVQAIEAGLASNKLGETLVRIGRHQQSMDRLRHRTLRAIAYPASVLFGLTIVTTYIGWFVLPGILNLADALQFEQPTYNRRIWTPNPAPMYSPPLLTEIVIGVARLLPIVLIALAVGVAVVP
ncbi:MAG TPA: type II secretion system F family protein, partial [Tepidisphaeraceae bacterium]|nr:type II secretion system F family protein [Tepidisphaeraceae bacterium]